MKFRLDIVPPTATAQEKKITSTRNGRVLVYDGERAKAAKELLTLTLKRHVPKEPMTGPLRLCVVWEFPRPKRARGLYKTTRPDTDNLDKGLKDVMTKLGFWHDDAQVCIETIAKLWSDRPGITITLEALEYDDNDGTD